MIVVEPAEPIADLVTAPCDDLPMLMVVTVLFVLGDNVESLDVETGPASKIHELS